MQEVITHSTNICLITPHAIKKTICSFVLLVLPPK